MKDQLLELQNIIDQMVPSEAQQLRLSVPDVALTVPLLLKTTLMVVASRGKWPNARVLLR